MDFSPPGAQVQLSGPGGVHPHGPCLPVLWPVRRAGLPRPVLLGTALLPQSQEWATQGADPDDGAHLHHTARPWPASLPRPGPPCPWLGPCFLCLVT